MRKPTFFYHTENINFLYSNLFTIIFLYCVQLEPFFSRFLFLITIVVCLFILYIVL